MDLSDARTFTVISGMGGGAPLPDAISHREMQAWSELTGNPLNIWEAGALKAMDKAWRAAFGEKKSAAPRERHQALGEYCRDEHVAECRKEWGAALEQVCRTCPD